MIDWPRRIKRPAANLPGKGIGFPAGNARSFVSGMGRFL
jgi:hypothetical protein